MMFGRVLNSKAFLAILMIVQILIISACGEENSEEKDAILARIGDKTISVKEFIRPEQFEKYQKIGLEMGFRHVESGALVRSSYKAAKHIL